MCVFVIFVWQEKAWLRPCSFSFYRNVYIEKPAAPHITARRVGDYLN